MLPLTEAQIIRTMAVAGLVVGLLVSAYILFNSGIVGGSAPVPVTVEPLDSAAAPAPATTSTPGVTGETTGAETTAPTTTRPGNTYVVQSGDSFYTIARKYNTSIAQIQQMNPDLDPSNLSTGTSVNVP